MKNFRNEYCDDYTKYLPLYPDGIICFVVFGLILIALFFVLAGELISDGFRILTMLFLIMVSLLFWVLYAMVCGTFIIITFSYQGVMIDYCLTHKKQEILWQNVAAVHFHKDAWYQRNTFRIFLKNNRNNDSPHLPCDCVVPISHVDIKTLEKFIPSELYKTKYY